MTTLAQRIQEIIDAGFPQVELARFAGVTKGTSNQWISGGIKSIKYEYAKGIESATGFRAEWIVTGKEPKKVGAERRSTPGGRRFTDSPSRVLSIDDEETNPAVARIRKVRLKLSAGITGFAVEPEVEDGNPIYFRRDWLALRGYKPENLIALRVKGESMEPNLYAGDVVVVNTADATPKDGDVFAVNYEGEDVIKRMVRDAGKWWLSSDNPDDRRFPRKECAGDMCLIIGRVIHKQSERI